ncbi:MAG: hypothetical protein ABIE70_12660 [bacterium]
MSLACNRAGITLLTLVLATALCVPVITAADNPADDCPKAKPSRGFIGFGNTQYDPSETNNSLEATGYEIFEDTRFSIDFAYYRMHPSRLVTGGEFAICADASDGPNGYDAVIFNQDLHFNLGYLVHRSRRLTAFPFVGVGYGIQSLNVRRNDSTSFESMLINPRGSARFTALSLLFRVGFHADFMLPLFVRNDRDHGPVLGIRASYTVPLTKGSLDMSWRNGITGLPEADHTGFQAHVLIGWGSQPTAE